MGQIAGRIRRKLARKPNPNGTGEPPIVTPDGQSHRFLNAAYPLDRRTQRPIAPRADACCDSCLHAYTELARQAAAYLDANPRKVHAPACTCSECREDASIEHALALQAEWGIELGARCTLDKSEPDNRASEYELRRSIRARLAAEWYREDGGARKIQPKRWR